MPLSVVVGFGWKHLWVSGLACKNIVKGNLRWYFLFPWCVLIIGVSHYWQGFIRASGIQHCVILRSLGQSMPCASNQLRCNCLWMPRCVTPVPVVGWPCRLIFPMLRILGGSAWVSRATLMEFSISMIGHCRCIPQCHIHRRLNIVLLVVWQRLCCWLGTPIWWNVGGNSSIVGYFGDAIVGSVAVPIVSPSSVSVIAGLGIIVLVRLHVLRDWYFQSMIPVYFLNFCWSNAYFMSVVQDICFCFGRNNLR